MGSVRVKRVGRAALRRSFRRRSLKRCAAFFVSPVSSERRNEIATAAAPGVEWVTHICAETDVLAADTVQRRALSSKMARVFLFFDAGISSVRVA